MASQTLFLMRTLLLLNSWKLLCVLPVVAYLLFGIQIFHQLSKKIITQDYKWNRCFMNPPTFAASKVSMIGDHLSSETRELVKSILRHHSGNTSAFLKCRSEALCFSLMSSCMFMHQDVTHSRELYYIDSAKSSIICQGSYLNMIQCAYLSQLVDLIRRTNSTVKKWLDPISFFQHVTKPANIMNTASSDICVTDDTFFANLRSILTLEIIIASGLISTYLLATTVASINELKSRGFLQLMMRKGLSPLAYWTSVWLITVIEMLVFATCLTASFVIQCPKFYTTTQSAYSFLLIYSHYLFMAKLVLFFTVLSNNYYTVCRYACIYLGCSLVMQTANTVVARFQQSASSWNAVKTALLMVPLGNLADHLNANFIEQLEPQVERNIHTPGLLVTGLGVLLLGMVTFYLDSVLPTGNGFCYPRCFCFRHSPAFDPLPRRAQDDSNVEESSDELRVFARVVSVALPGSASSDTLSADFYNEQISAVFCKNSAHSDAFVGLLTGRICVSRGCIWVDGCTVSDPMARFHTHTRIGECLQQDALSHRLTVLHTLKMALVSGGVTWSDSETEIGRMLSLLRLADSLHCAVGCLSKGQRRKLCVALALLGNPRLVVLQDATRGLDPLSRQRLWRLLQDYRTGRCIVVSTQFIDEADMFANKKIFLSRSGDKVVCAGTSSFIRFMANRDLIVRVTLKDATLGQALGDKFRVSLPDDVKLELRDSQLLVSLSNANAHLLPAVVKALRASGDDFVSVGLNHSSLSAAYNCITQLGAPSHASNSGKISASMHVARLTPSRNAYHIEIHKEAQQASIGRSDRSIIDNNRSNDNDAEAEGLPAEEQPRASGTRLSAKSNRLLTEGRPSAPCASGCAMCAICLLYFLLVRKNTGQLLNRFIFYLALLALHVLMVLMEMQVTASTTLGSVVWASEFSNVPPDKFTHGICISHSGAPVGYKISAAQCGKVFTGALTSGNNFIVLEKSPKIYLNTFLADPTRTKLISDLCKKVKYCPVVYSNSWSTTDTMNKKGISIGSVSPQFGFDPKISAATITTATRAVLKYFLLNASPSKQMFALYHDYREMFIVRYGVLSQTLILTILPALYLEDTVSFKATELRSYLYTAGVNKACYWTGMFLTHWPQYAVTYYLSVVVSIAIYPKMYLAGLQTALVSVAVIGGLINNLLLNYVFSCLFSRSRVSLPVASILLGVLSAMAPSALQTCDIVTLVLIATWPPFASAALILHAARLHFYTTSFNVHASKYNVPPITVLFHERYMLTSLAVIPAHTVCLVTLLFALESFCAKPRCCSKNAGKSAEEHQYTDHDDPTIGACASTSQQGDANAHSSGKVEHTLKLTDLTQIYVPDIPAIRKLDLCIPSGQTLAIVGANGSGVTTLVRSIMGECRPTSGEIEILRAGKAQDLIAYAPEWGPLFDALTPQEHLEKYARMFGASSGQVNDVLQLTGLSECKSTSLRSLTEGHKRRLSLAIALLCRSPILLVDDISTGINSAEEVELWQNLSKLFDRYVLVITTSHSLTGAQLTGCPVALLNHGLLVFHGTVEEFRELHGCHILEIEFPSEAVEEARAKKAAILKAIFGRFYSPDIIDQSLTWIRITIPKQIVGRDIDALRWLLELKERYDIVDLLFYPASLDQLFEISVKNHEAKVQNRPKAMLNPNAPPLVPFYERYLI